MLKTDERKKLSPEEEKALLKILTYEKVNGKPIYYRNYKKVLKGELLPEAVRARTALQAFLLTQIMFFLIEALGTKRYLTLPGELRFYYKKNSWRSIDIGIFEREKFEPFILSDKPLTAPPKVAIQIDTKADLSRYSNLKEYTYEKTQDLLDAGVEKVVWIFTRPKKVLIAEKGKKWIVQDVAEDIPLIEGIVLNLKELAERDKNLKEWLKG